MGAWLLYRELCVCGQRKFKVFSDFKVIYLKYTIYQKNHFLI